MEDVQVHRNVRVKKDGLATHAIRRCALQGVCRVRVCVGVQITARVNQAGKETTATQKLCACFKVVSHTNQASRGYAEIISTHAQAMAKLRKNTNAAVGNVGTNGAS